MPRSRAKSPPRLTRDAERLIALANGLNASGSLTEDRFWESEMSTLVARLLQNGNDAPIDAALDHLYQTNLGAYDTLIELVESESESVVVMQGDRAWESLLIAAPLVAWSKYAIPSGTIPRGEAEALKVQLQGHVLADGARLALVPYLYSIDQLPRHFSELRKLAARLADAAVSGEIPRLDLARLPETAQLLADTRFLIASVAVPRGQAMFRWQEDASGHAGRAGSLEQCACLPDRGGIDRFREVDDHRCVERDIRRAGCRRDREDLRRRHRKRPRMQNDRIACSRTCGTGRRV